ncbi:MAG: hypothetical protein ACAI44_01420 [Candidatus Sericytochromatia bacterium]
MDPLQAFSPCLGGQPGFEIWFAVMITPDTRQAIWVRYTLFRPAAGCPLPASGILWASFYDAHHPELHCAGAERFEIDQIRLETAEVGFPRGLASPSRLTGELATGLGLLSWDLRLTQAYPPLKYAPAFLENLGIAKTKAVITAPFAKADGEVRLADKAYPFIDAGSLLTHIWGSHYLEELYWIFVPGFEGDSEGWALEIVSARPKPLGLAFTFAILTCKGKLVANHLLEALSARVKPHYPLVNFEIKVGSINLSVDCCLDRDQTTRYVYTNPDGARRYIAHSDTGEVSCRIERPGSTRLLLARTAAVEFHGCQPWDQEPYINPLA